MKKKKNMSKFFIGFIVVIYVLVSGFFLFFLFSKNDLGLNEIGNYYLINSGNLTNNDSYGKGNLIVIEKVKFDDIKQSDEIVLYKNVELQKNVLFVVSNVDKKNNKDNDRYLTLVNDNYHWKENSIIGKVKNTYSGVGYIMSIFDSGNLFFILLFIPALVMFIYELCVAFNIFKKDNKNENKNVEILDDNTNNNVVENNSTPVEENKVVEENKNVDSTSTDVEEDANNLVSESENDVVEVTCEPQIIVPDIDLSDEEIQSGDIETLIENKLSSIVINNGNSDGDEEKKDENNSENENVNNENVENNEEQNNEPVVIGKGIKNFTLKILELKKYEILDILKIFNESRNNVEIPDAVLQEIIALYVNDKYLQPIDYSDSDMERRHEIMTDKINHYTDRRRILDLNQKKEITELLSFYNELDEDYGNLENILDKLIKFDSELDKKIFVNCIRDKAANYDRLMNSFSDKIASTKVFNLITTNTVIEDVYNTQVKSNIKFSKMFSEYIIDKSYGHSVVMENLQEVLLKLVSAQLLKELFEFNYKNRYIIHFNDSLYSKDEKLDIFIDNFDDPFSQKKILILIDVETIKKHKIKLDKLKSKGFNFVIQISTGDLMNVEFDNKNLALGDFLIIIGEVNESEVKTLIPKDLQKNTFYVSEPLYTEVIKQ